MCELAPLDLMSMIRLIELDLSFTHPGGLSVVASLDRVWCFRISLLFLAVVFLPSFLSLLSFSLTPLRAVKSLAMFSQKWVTQKQGFLGCEGWAHMDVTLQ